MKFQEGSRSHIPYWKWHGGLLGEEMATLSSEGENEEVKLLERRMVRFLQ